MTVDDAARIAKRADARRAVLVHISPRYSEDDMEKLGEAAAKRFPMAEMGGDLKWYTVPHREDHDA